MSRGLDNEFKTSSGPGNWILNSLWWLRGHHRHVSQIEALIDDGRWQEADSAIRKQLARFPGSAQLQRCLANLEFVRGNQEAADAIARKVIGNDSAKVAEFYQMGELLGKQGDLPTAIQCLEKVVQLGQNDIAAAAHQKLAMLKLNQQHSDNAVDHAVKATMMLHPPITEFLDRIHTTSLSPETIQRAIKTLNQADMSSTSFAASKHMLLSRLHIANDDWSNAISSIGRATRFEHNRLQPEAEWDKSSQPMKPGFVIFGAMKSGTTALWDQLKTHPQVLSPLSKELQFFGHADWPEEYYFEMFPRIRDAQQKGLITGEASPGYYMDCDFERLKKMQPDVRLVFIRRDPVERSLSHFFHNRELGLDSKSMAEVFRNGFDETRELYGLSRTELKKVLLEQKHQQTNINFLLAMSCYDLFLDLWKPVFGEDQILEIEFESLVNDNERTINKVLEFIGVEKSKCQPLPRSNSGRYNKQSPDYLETAEKLRQFFAETESMPQPKE